MIVTLLSALAGGVVATALAFGGVAILQPHVDPPVSQSQMVKYGDSSH